jgi:hypothetical protein
VYAGLGALARASFNGHPQGVVLSQASRIVRLSEKSFVNQELGHLMAKRGDARFLDRVLIPGPFPHAARNVNLYESTTYVDSCQPDFLDRVLIDGP